MNQPLSTARERTGWYFYDWANSAFATTVVTLLLGPYLSKLAQAAADARGFVHPLGIPVYAGSYWGYLIALSVASQVLCLPVLGALADSSRRKKELLGLFAYVGALATAMMFFLVGREYLLGGFLFLVSNLSFGASVVVYNSFLPEIASERERDAVSSKGWGIGYLGGGLLLALNLVLAAKAGALGLTEEQAIRINLCSAGVWWGLFTVIPLATLRNREGRPDRLPRTGPFRQLGGTLRDLRHYPEALKFLLAYLLYNDAIQAVITLATEFGYDELKIPIATLSLAILMVQFVAFFGALAFNWVAARIGAQRAIMLALAIWTAVLVDIYISVRTTGEFFAMAAVVALVLGGSQALSRSLFSQMIPKSKEAEYFGLYEISDKGTSWLCPLLFGLALQFTRSYRLAILSLILFFALGLAVLARVDVRRAAREAGNEVG
ncbi:MAG: MFS transporter [Bryobacteraceae bacterium]|jgi:UMF1 family MFS transporter